MGTVIHMAGIDMQVDTQLRQRCAWCGALLIDYALDRIAVPVGTDPRPATWPVGSFVAVDGSLSYMVDPAEERGDGSKKMPDDCCGRLDPEVTR